MSHDHPQLTPELARERLRDSEARSLDSSHDRRVYAIGTAVFGCTCGVLMCTQNIVTGLGAVALSILALIILVGETVWVERAARTVPRGARLWSRLGIGASFFLALAIVLPWLNLRAQDEPNTWPMVLVAAFVVTLPSLIAAAVIQRGSR